MSIQRTAKLLQGLAEALEGLSGQIDKALTLSRRVSLVVDKMAERAWEQVDEVKPVNTE